MKTKIKPRTRRVLFYVLALVLTLIVLLFQHSMANLSQNHQDLPGVVSGRSLNENDPFPEAQQKAIDIYATMSGLLATLATALLGGLGYLLLNARQENPGLLHGFSAVGSAAFAVISLYFGYVCHLKALWFTFHASFDPATFAIYWPRQAQFYSLLTAVFFFADFAFHELGTETTQKPSPEGAK